MNKKVILMILDGWGKSPDPKVSAIDNANVPFINSLYTKYPNAQLRTDGLNVGLPEGQMGNSEVGHMNLGAGRIVYQDLAKINLAVANKTINQEKELVKAFEYAKKNNKILILNSHKTVDKVSGDYQTKNATLEYICKYVKNNNMNFYTLADLEKLH